MKIAIAAFAKTIGLSAVKTRLAADIGEDQAEVFYSLSVSAIEEVLISAQMENAEIFPHWALAENEAVGREQWRRIPALWTGEGGLGQRLATISETLFENHDGVILIGTDSPQISPSQIMEAANCLRSDSDDIVVGPAKDGGFYLFASARPVAREAWESVAYSVETTLAELLSKLVETDAKVHLLQEEQDVDEVSDLITLKSRLSKMDNLSASQSTLLEWLRHINES